MDTVNWDQSAIDVELIVTLVILAIVFLAIYYIISIWIYKRAPANMAFIRTGLFGTKVCLGRGAVVLPVFHEVAWVSLETIKIIVSRSRDQAILTQDKIRVDVVAELYAHVGRSPDEILTASRSLGEKTFDPDKVRNLLEAKVVSALRSDAATKSLSELHENREAFAQAIKANVMESFAANGLVLEEATIGTLEQSSKEFFRPDNVFDAEGLKIITEITSAARREVHNTEKRTTVAIRKRDLDTQLELLEIERQEAFARASQDKSVSNEQALQLGEKQVYVLEQRLAVETKEIENDKALEQMRTARDLSVIDEARKRETAQIEKALALEQSEKDRQIALTRKSQEEEVANIRRELARQSAEKDREVELIAKERQRQEADILRVTAVSSAEETSRNERHHAAETASLAIRKRALDTRLAMLELDKAEAFAAAQQDQQVADEQARLLSEKQRFLIEQRWQVEQEELAKELALEKARITKDVGVSIELRKREAADIQRALAREQEERDREIVLVGKAEELERARVAQRGAVEQAERDREIALVAKDEKLERTRIRQALAVEVEERDSEIALIAKEQQREAADIQRFLAREQEESDREIAMAAKTRELEEAVIDRLHATTQREEAQHRAESVRVLADVERSGQIKVMQANSLADSRKVDEENKAQITRMHMISQAESRRQAADQEAEATLVRAKADSEAVQIAAVGMEKQAAVPGRAEAEVEALRVVNRQRMLEAEASGIHAKAKALKTFDEGATFLELARLNIEAERDVHMDQAKAMGTALQGADIRMFGGGDGTVDTIRDLFTKGFSLGEGLEGLAQSLPAGMRERFARNGLRGIFGRPYGSGNLSEIIGQLEALVERTVEAGAAREEPFAQVLGQLQEAAADDEALMAAVGTLAEFNQSGMFDAVPFSTVWSMLEALAKKG